MGQVFVFAITAAFNPTLLAAVTVMLVLDNPRRLLWGYLLGAMMTSVTLGLVIVLTLGGSSGGTSTAKHTINPVLDIALGVLVLIVAFVVGTGRDPEAAGAPRAQAGREGRQGATQVAAGVSGASARTSFVVGALLTCRARPTSRGRISSPSKTCRQRRRS